MRSGHILISMTETHDGNLHLLDDVLASAAVGRAV